MQSLFGPFAIKDRLAEDLAAASPLPKHRFDPCVVHPAVAVDKYQTVAFDGNRYSVPRPFAFRTVTVKGYVDRVVIVAAGPGRRDSRSRSLEKHEDDPRPAPLPGDAGPQARRARPRAGLSRLEAAGMLRRLPRRPWSGTTGPRPGPGGSCGSCNCSAEHPLTRVRQAIEKCMREHLDQCRGRDPAGEDPRRDRGRGRATRHHRASRVVLAAQVRVPLPDLSRFDQLLGGASRRDAHDETISRDDTTVRTCYDI